MAFADYGAGQSGAGPRQRKSDQRLPLRRDSEQEGGTDVLADGTELQAPSCAP